MSLALTPISSQKYSRAAFYIQSGCVVACLFGLQWWPAVPGVAIGFLGVAAAIMAVRAEHFTPWEGAIWIAISFALFVVEIRVIYNDRAEHDAQQAEMRTRENEARQKEADSFAALLKEGHSLFGATQQVEALTKKNLENITGGESFAIVTPQVWSGLVPIPLSIRNYGKQTITGVTVGMYGTESFDLNNPRSFYDTPLINVGTLHSGELRLLKETITPVEGGLKESDARVDQYQLHISAQNFTVVEYLWFKKGKRLPWVFKYQVTRQFVTSQTKNKTTFGYKTLAKTKWTGE